MDVKRAIVVHDVELGIHDVGDLTYWRLKRVSRVPEALYSFLFNKSDSMIVGVIHNYYRFLVVLRNEGRGVT